MFFFVFFLNINRKRCTFHGSGSRNVRFFRNLIYLHCVKTKMGIQLSFDCARHSTGHTEHKNSPNNLSNNCCCCISGAMEYNYYWTDSQSYFIIIHFNHFSFRFLFCFFFDIFSPRLPFWEDTTTRDPKNGGGGNLFYTHKNSRQHKIPIKPNADSIYTTFVWRFFSLFILNFFFFLTEKET